MPYETPEQLLARLRLGREEFCQRLLTCLIVDGPYPRWNTRSKPSEQGLEFLRRLYVRAFGFTWPDDDPDFVDELELSPRHDAEKGGAPDYAVLWNDVIWIMELKTEKASHRKDQIPSYFDLAHHHYPTAQVHVLYVTPPMEASYDHGTEWARYAHITWADVAEVIRTVWPRGSEESQQAVIDGLTNALDQLHLPARAWREQLTAPAAQPEPPPPLEKEVYELDRVSLDDVMAAARETAHDGQQRAVEFMPHDLEELLELRLNIRNELAASPTNSPLRHVQPWIWRPESTGTPLTAAGAEVGMELRLSRYQNPLY